MSIQSNFPNLKPSLLLDFANTKQLDNRITFTRSTPAVYYDGKTTAMAEQNLTLQSQSIGNSPWSVEGVTFTTSSTAPDGTSTATAFTEQTNSGTHRTYQSQSYVSGSVYTISFYAKYVSRQYLQLNASGIKSGCRVIFDIQNGTVTDASTATTTSIISVGNSWYRCIATITNDTGSNTYSAPVGGNSSSTGNGESYVGSGNLAFYLWGFQTEQRASATAYTVTTTQTITNYIPVLLTAGGNQPRFDCNPTTGESLGLLIEEQRTNQITNSTNFSIQSVTNVSVYNNTIIAPDGTLTGAMIQDDSTNGQHGIIRTYAVTSGQTNTTTVYLKYGTQRYVSLVYPSATSTRLWATFDLLNGTITGSWANVATITAVGNGWYRCSVVETAGATGSAYLELQFNSTGVNPSWPSTTQPAAYAGIGSYFYAWGMQGETGSFATSYIATTSASATRTADAASMTGTNFSSWYNQAQGTIYADATTYMDVTNTANRTDTVTISEGTASTNSMLFGVNTVGSANVMYLYTLANGSPQVDLQLALTSGSYKTSYAYKVNDFALCLNGSSASTDGSGILSYSVNQMWIGSRFNSGQHQNGTIKKIAYYPIRVTNAQLQALTT